MAKYLFVCALIAAIFALTVLAEEGQSESSLADWFAKLQSLSSNLTSEGAENFKKLQENLTPLFQKLQNASAPLIEDVKKKYLDPDSPLAKELKKQYEEFGAKKST